MIVIKLGGSLVQSRQLSVCLASVERRYQGRAVVIVPGGGDFAEQVRLSQQVWQFDDRIAHEMAILAMQQMALLFHGLKKSFVLARSVSLIRQQLEVVDTLIWSPDIAELDQAGIAASWDITSDSLAVWLANRLSADALVLVKSAAIDPQVSWHELAKQQIVDQAFYSFAAHSTFPITLINAQQFHG